MKRRQHIGLQGEERAAGYFRDHGFEILERRYRFGHKEIDLVVRKGDLIIFVEVKSRRNEVFGPARLSITPRKRLNLVEAARGYLFERIAPGGKEQYRFDVILLHPPDKSGESRLEHIADAFRP